jgi:hypothetical protein
MAQEFEDLRFAHFKGFTCKKESFIRVNALAAWIYFAEHRTNQNTFD